MTSSVARPVSITVLQPGSSRLDYLDATRAFALVLGVAFHATLSFMPVFIGWAVMDVSTSPLVSIFFTISHSFRMETFFLLAGFLGHANYHRKGAREFVRTRVLRIAIPFVVGWFILRPLIVSGWIMGSASLRGDFDFWAGIKGGFESLSSLPAGIFTGSHLWFLYYLAMITALTLVLRGLVTLADPGDRAMLRRADAFVAWLANSRLSLPVLVLPTALSLWFMRGWGVDTPDQTLRPHFPVVIVYGSFFILGWMLHRQPDLISRFARLSVESWVGAASGLAGTILLSPFQLDPGHPHHLAAQVGFTLSYALMMWSLVSLLVGIFRKLCHRPRPFIRYVADSSYWLYLIHLPIVVWLQVAVAEIPLHWSLKLAFISTATLALSLVSYDLFVRSTFIGWILNGTRRDRVLTRFILSNSPPGDGRKPYPTVAEIAPH